MTVGESINVYAVHPGRMNTDMGRTTAQIEPEEAAIGFCNILEGTTHIERINGLLIIVVMQCLYKWMTIYEEERICQLEQKACTHRICGEGS